MPHIRTVLYDQYRLEECVNEINGLRAGLIRIGTFNSVSAQWLPGIIRSLPADYPAIRFELLHGTNRVWYHVHNSRLHRRSDDS